MVSKQTQDSLALTGILSGTVGLVAFLALMIIGEWRFAPAVFVGLLIAIVVFLVLLFGFHGRNRAPQPEHHGHGAAQGAGSVSGAGATAAAGATGAAAVSGSASADAAAAARKAAEEEAAKKAADDAAAKKAAEDAAAKKAAEDAAAKTAADAAAKKAADDAAAKAAADKAAADAAARKAADDAAAKAKADADAAAAASAAAASAKVDAVAAVASDEEDYDGDGVVEGKDEGRRPEGLTAARDGKADDLKQIKGIGPKLEKLCNTLGFYHFDQIAAWGADEVAWVDANLEGFKGRVSRDTWVAQAKILATGGETEFSKKVEDGDVY